MSEDLYKLRNGLCREFVKRKQGRWDHSGWVAFLADVRKAGYRAVSDGDVGLELEAARQEFWKAYYDLRTKFVHQMKGNWNHSDWIEFLADVRKAGYDFLTDAEVGLDLETDKTHYWNYWVRDLYLHDENMGFQGVPKERFGELVKIDFPRAIGFLDDFINANRYSETMGGLEILCTTGEESVLERMREVLDRLESGSFKSSRIGNDLYDFEEWLKRFYPRELTLLVRVQKG